MADLCRQHKTGSSRNILDSACQHSSIFRPRPIHEAGLCLISYACAFKQVRDGTFVDRFARSDTSRAGHGGRPSVARCHYPLGAGGCRHAVDPRGVFRRVLGRQQKRSGRKWRCRWRARRTNRCRFSKRSGNRNASTRSFKPLIGSKQSPLSQIFRAGYIELSKIKKQQEAHSSERPMSELGGMENIERSMRRASSSELTHLESLVPFLATTGSTSPFIGLFGTVWGNL